MAFDGNRTLQEKPDSSALGFLLSATNPENGTANYTYSNNLLAGKTDAKGQNFTYQQHNRRASVRFGCHRPYPVIRSDSYKHVESEDANDDR